MADRAERAQSFGAIAPDYDRLRPSPPDAALDWLIPEGCRVAVDLAAGTGLFTRALAARVVDVVAVEPDERMRAVLADRSPGVRAVEGRGEAIPLADASADALFVSSAWHWMDPERAVPEIARVLRDGGRFGVLWTGRDREVDWVRELDRAAAGGESLTGPDVGPDMVAGADQPRRRPHRDVDLPDANLFQRVEQASFPFVRAMAVDDVVESLATYSQLIVLEAAERAQALAQARQVLLDHFGTVPGIDVPMRSWCWRADRIPGSRG
jgi:SAM-dependent methyltransferase